MSKKIELINAASEGYLALRTMIEGADRALLEQDFAPLAPSKKCTTFQQGNNLRDLLMHAFEWQRLQAAFVANIRNNTPKDFIPDPWRKDYHGMDHANWERHQSITLDDAEKMLDESHQEMLQLMETFTEEELFEKKVFKVTYTTTMAAYFQSVTTSPYTQIVKRLKPHLKAKK